MTTSVAFDRIIDTLNNHGSNVRENGNGQAKAQCPAHNDRNPSLSITSIEESVLLHCHAGCSTADVLAVLDLKLADLYDNRHDRT